MGVTAVCEAVAARVAAGGENAGGDKEPADAAGGGPVAGIIDRLRKVFGSDARSVDALEQARRLGSPAAVADLAAALAWYAGRDRQFAAELAQWAAKTAPVSVAQQVFAARDAYVAGGNQTVVNYRSTDE